MCDPIKNGAACFPWAAHKRGGQGYGGNCGIELSDQFSNSYRMGGCNKLKYCSKCGNELMDEAVICPKCGCPVENSTNQGRDSKLNKVKTAFFLNLIAFVIAAFTVANYLLLGGSGNSESDQNTKMLLLGMLGLVALSFVLCIVNMVLTRKGHARSVLV